jgi:hypothetical protein
MLDLLLSSVHAGERAGGFLPKNDPSSIPIGADGSKSFHSGCSACGSFEFWVPVGHVDGLNSRRCWKCKPPPSMALVGLKIGFAANSSIAKSSNELIDAFRETTAAFGPYWIGAGKSVCPRCTGALVKFDQTGYRCGTCIHKLDDAILDELLWGCLHVDHR